MSQSLPALLDLPLPSSPLLNQVISYVRSHTSPSTLNHSIRAFYFARLLSTRLPQFATAPTGAINYDLVAFACIMHDLGWATTRSLISEDKRFEVDGANLAVKFVDDNKDVLKAAAGSHDHNDWTAHDNDTLWSAIALHATPSLAQHHPRPEVVITQFGIMSDFFGPYLPPPFPEGIITKDEYLTIIKAFPREGFKEEIVQIFCGFCRVKPETTLDNWQWQFGAEYGVGGKGDGKEEWMEKVKESQGFVKGLMGGLEKLHEIEPKEMENKGREKYWYEKA